MRFLECKIVFDSNFIEVCATDNSVMIQATTGFRTSGNHCPNQCWPSSLAHIRITRPQWINLSMMTSSNGNIFRVTGHLCEEFTGHGWIPRKKASDAELWYFLICAWINGWVNNREAGDLRRHRAHNNVTVMLWTEMASSLQPIISTTFSRN